MDLSVLRNRHLRSSISGQATTNLSVLRNRHPEEPQLWAGDEGSLRSLTKRLFARGPRSCTQNDTAWPYSAIWLQRSLHVGFV